MQPFEEVVAEHGPAVLRVCRALLTPHEAEDAWSETFLAALRAYPDLAEGANVRAWLVTIAYRKAVDGLRTRRREPLAVEHLPERPDPRLEPGPDGLAVRTAVAALPPRQRQAVAYHYLAGLPYAEVAELVGSTPDAARRAAADGIAALRRHFPEEDR